MNSSRFKAVFCDIGGVLGTNGWDSGVRSRVCSRFGIDRSEIDDRHRLMFDSFERGFIDFDEYLANVFFFCERAFSLPEVREFVFAQSIPWPDNLNFLRHLRLDNAIKVGLISNEGQGIADYRVERFGLREVCDFMVISHFTGLRKPDPRIWHMAAKLAGVQASESIYIDDRSVFAHFSTKLGFTAIHHTDLDLTRRELRQCGMNVREAPVAGSGLMQPLEGISP